MVLRWRGDDCQIQPWTREFFKVPNSDRRWECFLDGRHIGRIRVEQRCDLYLPQPRKLLERGGIVDLRYGATANEGYV